ncbi:MAG: adenylosuccinate lyase [Syntrophobacterales bacterium]|nr:adenylosuccinate lyase [Syntrophobacterales bacterium]
MIPRYTRPEMGTLWSQENRYRKWLEVELAVCEVRAERGEIPWEDWLVIKERANFDPRRVEEIEEVTKHDVIAFITNVAEFVGAPARFIHEGLTSSDVLDTSFALLLVEASDILLKDIDLLMKALKTQAFRWKDLIMIGRSHGVHAEPITLGLKFALWYEEMKRNRERLWNARESIRVGKISGAVGTYASIDPEVERDVCEKLGLKPDPISTQIIQRDRHAEFFSTLAIIGCTVEKIAVEIRHLQRTEVREAEEYFAPGQKGSSAMPHKRNPIGCENLSGLARILRANALAAMENVALWHERDISHSSVERIIGPDSTILLDYMLNRLTNIIENLTVYPENIARNLALTGGLFNSQRVMLALTQKGLPRNDAYELVQRNAMKVWQEGGQLKERLMDDPDVMKYLSLEELEGLFDLRFYARHVETIFSRVFGKTSQ